MRIVVLLTSVLLAVGVANAAPTTVCDTANFTSDGLYFLPPGFSPGYVTPFYRYYYQDWGWDHAVTFDPAPDPSATFNLLSATLTVHAWQVDEPDLISGDGHPLGNLVYQPPALDGWTTTTFDLASILGDLADGQLDVWLNINTAGCGTGIVVDWAKLCVTYEWVVPQVPPVPPVVPAPAAVVLAGIGTGLIGLLRRRRNL